MQHSHPPTMRGGKPATAAAPHREEPAPRTKRCRRCEARQPEHTFVLAQDPRAKDSPIRHWCGECLVRRGHVPHRRLEAAHKAHAAQVEARRAAAADDAARREAERAIHDDMLTRATEDPEYARILLTVAAHTQVRRSARQ